MSVGFRERLDGQSLELLAHAFGRSPVPKLVLSLMPDEYGQFITVNDAFCELVGYSRDELVGRSCLILLDEENLGPVMAAFDAMVRGERTVVAMERVLVRQDGSRVWVFSQNVMVRDRAGRPFLVAEVVESSSRPALADSEARFRTLVDSSPIGMAVLNTDGAWLRVNPAVAALLGYTGAELAALTLGTVTHPDDSADCAAMLRDLASEASAGFEGRSRLVRKDGEVIWCRLSVTPLRSESGAPLQLLAQLADVTAEQRGQELIAAAQQRLERSERQFAEVADNSPIARIVIGLRGDERGRIILTNPAFCRLFGFTDAEAVGMPFQVLQHGDAGELDRNLDRMASGERTRGQGELTLHRKDDTPLTVAAHTSVIADEHGPATAVVQLLDVTAERAARRAAGDAAEREVRRLRGTLAVQRAVTAAATDRDSAVRAVADRAVELFPAADGAAVELVEGDQLAYVATAGTLAPFTGTRIPRAGSLSGIALATDAPAHCPDTRHDARVNQSMCEQLGIGAMLIAPLHAENDVIGVLKVAAGAANVFDDTDEQQLALLADSLSAALQHADDASRNAELLNERTRALAELSISEQRFRLTFDNSPLGLTLCSLRPTDFGRYLQASPAMTTITGYTPDELTGMTFADLTHPDDVASTREYARRFVAGELDTVSLERRYLHKDGRTIWVTLRVAVVRDDDAQVRYAVIQVEDVTAAREADAQLRRSARLFELIPAAVIVRDLDGTIRWWNDGATRLYGWPLAAATGKSAHRLLHTTFPYEGGAAEQQESLRRDGYWNGHLDHITADGRTVNVLSRQVLHHPDPDNAQVLEVNSDVTAARAAERALAESEARLRAQFANTGVGQVISALDGTLISANRTYAAMIGRAPEELLGRHDHELVHPDDMVEHRRLLAGLFAGESDAYTTEARLAHADGHWVPVEWTISLVRDPAGHPKLLVGVLTDITARRAAEQARDAAAGALAERNTELEAANQLKLDIIGMLGHEIGNPLTSIRGNAEILTDDWPALSDERRGRAIDAIARQAHTLDEIVQEVLAMVTIESGKIRAERRALRLREEIDRALWAVDAAESIPVGGPDPEVLCHPGHLQQILVNLLSNARKYGGGATAVRVSAMPGLVEITVEDDGPGVPEEFRDRLFERLARADRDAAAVKGTGLGLYIVRGLAQANHGDIRYEPNPAGGSRFILSLESPGSARG
ncbi:hypothetical protein GCM10010168_27370 [Actinoplanes ianthinogenes]|uniref:histidine kinase n=1 Tax=Actinoplanes ianthinogenes TaxID=122358 RepID=A0ABM7LKS7_9ACTN|nr:PAS domain S-box protein [Actinoplanes ianthinogenes]BCJ39877.1 hypothetical protein Aiant_05340 [Actinoplanes ianthinogenes]GGR08748.1 hypothetical protein GCM10010168_27370 [Actinoplanes ianthinogenes]